MTREREDQQGTQGPSPEGGESDSSSADIARLETGIPRLDYILKGGFLRNGTYALMGPPGSGKTIFGNQLCFEHVRRSPSARCVYVTLLVESHSKMIRHLSGMRFFDPGMIPDRIYYISGYPALRDQGLAGLLDLLRRTLRERRGTDVLVIDGLESVEQRAPAALAYREFVHEVQGLSTLSDCTTFLLTSTREQSHPENALVDGVIELTDQLIGPRAVRELTVHKFRGSDYLRGKHEVEIDESGMVIHPRTEIQFDSPRASATEERKRMGFGIESFDAMIQGGLPSGSATALLGAPGTGKTLLGLSFLVEGARQGEEGIYFGFYEPPPRLREKARKVGIDLETHVKKGTIRLIWQPPLEHMMDSLAEQLIELLRQDPKPRRRLFIDGIEGFRAASVYPDRMARFLSAFTNQLRMLDVTTVVTEELDLFTPLIRMPNPELGNVVETVVLLRYVELRSQIHRLISILKMRESLYDRSIREFIIGERGIEVASSFRSAEQILSGHARVLGGLQEKEEDP
ncbi:ATPase domain-containing protein [Sorangium sp. So ce291]|uniref:RAD55 family ATPase n=1 Tax=Sorangium sp. So ce291 TaxID=3133294 RepID=UPI003F625813